MIIDLFLQRELEDCFFLVVPLHEDNNSIKELAIRATKVERLAQQVIKGQLSFDDFFDCVEDLDLNMDEYTDQVADGLDNFLVNIYGRKLCN